MLATLKVAALALLVAWDATAPVEVPYGFETGNSYLQMTETQRDTYVIGLFDALMASTVIGADLAVVRRIKGCFLEMNSKQIEAIFEKYLRQNPEQWHEHAGMLFLETVSHTCPGAIWPAQNLRKP